MIVLDASAVLAVLLATPAADAVLSRIREAGSLHAPHLLDAEVAQVLRRQALRGDLSDARGRGALVDHLGLPITRYPHTFLLGRAWDLRDSATAYDALYLALAEALDAPLLTTDGRLADVPGTTARVEVAPE